MESECKAKQVSEIKAHVTDLKAEAECWAKEAAWMAKQKKAECRASKEKELAKKRQEDE